jgi:FkbM family methyltransferase
MCQRVLNPGNCFFDIGANIGQVSLGLAKAFEDQVHIHAFEPQATLARHISLSAELNGFQNVSIYQTLVGETDGEADLFVPDALTFSSLKPKDNSSRIVRCRMTSLDHQISLGALPIPDVVKVDVEGAELQVFKGMEHVIAKHSPVIAFEASETISSRFGTTRSLLFEYLSSIADYDFYLLRDDPLRDDKIVRIDNITLESNDQNFLAAPAKDMEMRERLLL